MVEPDACRFWRNALQSGLLDAKAMGACWDAIPAEKRTADAIDRRLARRAIEAGLLTLWQAQQLLQGRVNGFKVDKYLLLDLIGQGGMGRVYLARDTRLGRRVAVKVLSRERMNNPRAVARFQREGRVGAQLQHENLVRIYDEGSAGGVCYLIMEYIEGRNAGQLAADLGRLPPAAAASLTRQVALGLEHAHQKGLIHRDVNPWNILVTKDGTAKLADMGLAIDVDDEEVVTRDGATVGTFDYISPEQARHSRNVDTRSDIYSLGCTLYHLLTGRVPFPCPSLPEKLFAHHSTQPDPILPQAPGVPPALEAVALKMMAKAPEDRYPHPLAAAEALAPFDRGKVPLDRLTLVPSAVAAPAGGIVEVAGPAGGSDLEGIDRAPALGPEPAKEASSGDVFASLNFGPEPALADGLKSGRSKKPKSAVFGKPKVKAAPEVAAEPAPAPEPDAPGPEPRRRLALPKLSRRAWIGAGAVAALLALVLGVLASTRSRSGDRPPPPVDEAPKSSGVRPMAPLGPITVRWPDGSQEEARDLQEALLLAARERGEVVLANSEPIHLRLTKPIEVPVVATIRAADGKRPILVIDDAGKQPWLRASSAATTLTLSGLTVWADFGEAEAVAPLVQAEGAVTLDRCAFVARGEGRGSRALLAEGLRTTVRGCWLLGFERALDLAAYPGTKVAVSQTIIAWGKGEGRENGWAVRLEARAAPGIKKPRQLTIDRVTVGGGGLLEVRGVLSQLPVAVKVSATVVRGPALLMWDAPPADFPKGLDWTGKEDRYEVSGASWIVLPPKGVNNLPDGPDDLESWTKHLPDEGTLEGPVKFAGDPIQPLKALEPKDFALVDDQASLAGADPALVGPGAKAPKP
ncbi:MAG TPA: serine/threonine-protein kinase [Isosphaeraceae bacterium]|jgi:hypothetical protein|nr:serine/threonine-protein kinase [Isosphaeraceae bacterium]